MVIGSWGCPVLAGLAFCPEAALVTVDTRTGGGREQASRAHSCCVVEHSGKCSIQSGWAPLEGPEDG